MAKPEIIPPELSDLPDDVFEFAGPPENVGPSVNAKMPEWVVTPPTVDMPPETPIIDTPVEPLGELGAPPFGLPDGAVDLI